MEPINKENAVSRLSDILSAWHRISVRLNILTVVCGFLTIITSVLVSVYTATSFIPDWVLKILACTSTASLTLLTAFNIVKKGNNAKRAWRLLNTALIRYENGVYNIKELIAVYENAEMILGDVDFFYEANSRSENLSSNENGFAVKQKRPANGGAIELF